MPDPVTPSPSELSSSVRTEENSSTEQSSQNGIHRSDSEVEAVSNSASIFGLHSLMVNVVLPLILLTGAVLVFFLLGSVEPEKRSAIDTTRVGRMKLLAPVRIEKLQSLKQTGTQLALEVDGTVVPFQEAKVAAEVAGRVTMKSIQCEAGQYVQQGDLLMTIDDTDYQIEVERLTRQKEQEYQSLREIDQEMANSQRMINITGDDVKLQKKEVDRQMAMPKGYASRGDIEKAQRSLNAATQQLINAENQLNLLRQRRIRLEASERLAATSLRAAEINLARTEIRAPIEGVIVSEEADVNTFVSRGQLLVVIDDTSKAEVASSMRMDQLYWVLDQAADPAQKSSPKMSRSYDLPETPALIEYEISGREDLVYRWKGRLLSYNGIGLDSETRTVPVRIIVDDPQTMVDVDGNPLKDQRMGKTAASALVRGMYVQVKLLISPQTPLVVIPARALRPGNRVFQFILDESVLAPKAMAEDDEKAAGITVVKDDSSQAPLAKNIEGDKKWQVDPFDPAEWLAGRVVSRRSVTPINSMLVLNKNSNGDLGLDQRKEKLWVCEVADQVIGPDSWVVVSPIGTVDGEFLPARALVAKPDDVESDDEEPEKVAEPAETSAAIGSLRQQDEPTALAAGLRPTKLQQVSP